MGNYTKEQFENVLSIYPDPVFWQLIFFKHGWLGLIHNEQLPADDLMVIRRFADVFEFAHTRFLDLQKAEAHALQAEEDLIAIKAARQRAEEALAELQVTQKQLIQSEKMASLGELTAGIAHEIQNPLNFVNNFSEVNSELIDELEQEVEKGNLDEVKALAKDIRENEQKINHHGKRADAIVKGMLQHSRISSGVKEPTDINALTDEYLRLAYHGLRAKDKSFNATLITDFDAAIGSINIIPQDIGRVILNLITNAFYAVSEKKKLSGPAYEPTVTVRTMKTINKVELLVTDNGNGIPQKIADKIFQPFFTTKPTGEGTGLGLSLSYDIVKAHGGELKVESEPESGAGKPAFTNFTLTLPILNNF
jgi:signal transduction histidine kinase